MDGISMIVASLAMTAGAADMALRILSASLAGGFTGPTFGDTAVACPDRTTATAPSMTATPSSVAAFHCRIVRDLLGTGIFPWCGAICGRTVEQRMRATGYVPAARFIDPMTAAKNSCGAQ
jgi:hypothetical protein